MRPSEGHKYGGQKLTETSVIEPCYKKRVLIFRNSLTLKSKLKACSENKIQKMSHF